MTKSETTQMSGEERLRKRRWALLRYSALGILGGMLVGMMSGMSAASYEDGNIPLGVIIAMIAVTAVGFIWFSMDYFKRIDEFDVLDNLWANTIGLYGGFIVLGSWYVLADIALVASPDAGAILGTFMGITLIAYLARKMGWR